MRDVLIGALAVFVAITFVTWITQDAPAVVAIPKGFEFGSSGTSDLEAADAAAATYKEQGLAVDPTYDVVIDPCCTWAWGAVGEADLEAPYDVRYFYHDATNLCFAGWRDKSGIVVGIAHVPCTEKVLEVATEVVR